jgi:hypothetical protein
MLTPRLLAKSAQQAGRSLMPETGEADQQSPAGIGAGQPSTKAKTLRSQPEASRVRAPAALRSDAALPTSIGSRSKEGVRVKEMIAGHAIVEILKAEGVRAVYGIPGGHVLPIYDVADIRHFLVRHEQAAASMTAGYAQLTAETAKRAMFESNFPVDKRYYSYGVMWNAFKRLAASYSAEEKADLFVNAARDTYRLPAVN